MRLGIANDVGEIYCERVANICYSKKYWESVIGRKQAKGLISGPSTRRTRDLLKVNRDQLR
jgi:hypothetical protein